MLVLKRRAGQSLVIGDEIEIQVLDVSPARVKLGIVAPNEVSVVRKEVVLTRQQNVSAAGTVSPDVLSWLSLQLAGVSTSSERQDNDSESGGPEVNAK